MHSHFIGPMGYYEATDPIPTPEGHVAVAQRPRLADGQSAEWDGETWAVTGAASVPEAPSLSRADFVIALTQIPTPPIFTEAEAMAALEAFPPKFAAALADKPLAYRAAAIEAWRTTTTVARDAALFRDLLAFYAAQAGLTDAQAGALGDAIFAGAANG